MLGLAFDDVPLTSGHLIGLAARGFCRLAETRLTPQGCAVGQLPVPVAFRQGIADTQADLARFAVTWAESWALDEYFDYPLRRLTQRFIHRIPNAADLSPRQKEVEWICPAALRTITNPLLLCHRLAIS